MQAKIVQAQTLIVGLGITGLTCARFLQAENKAFALWHGGQSAVDLTAIKTQFPKAKILLGDLDENALKTYQNILLSPGVPRNLPMLVRAQNLGITIESDVSLFVEYNHKPVLAVSGSNGKTTVVSLLSHLLKAQGLKVALGGNIGTGVLDLLDKDYDIAVLELSSFQLESTPNLNAQVACILNVTPDHLDRYLSFADYLQAKLAIFNGAQKMVANLDDEYLLGALPKQIETLDFSVQQTADFYIATYQNEPWLYAQCKPLIACSELALQGQHNMANALAALAICVQAGYCPEQLIAPLKTFSGLAHRCEYLGHAQGVAIYNDSKGTNVGATLAAIESVFAHTQGKLWLLAGGVGKEQDFSALKQSLQDKQIGLYLFGQDAAQIAQAVAPVSCLQFATLEEAYQALLTELYAGDSLLFSPACASFDQYANYMQRGDAFKQLVNIVRRQT